MTFNPWLSYHDSVHLIILFHFISIFYSYTLSLLLYFCILNCIYFLYSLSRCLWCSHTVLRKARICIFMKLCTLNGVYVLLPVQQTQSSWWDVHLLNTFIHWWTRPWHPIALPPVATRGRNVSLSNQWTLSPSAPKWFINTLVFFVAEKIRCTAEAESSAGRTRRANDKQDVCAQTNRRQDGAKDISQREKQRGHQGRDLLQGWGGGLHRGRGGCHLQKKRKK